MRPMGLRGLRRWLPAIVPALLILLALAALAGLRLARAGEVLSGVQVGSLDVGGLSEEELHAQLARVDRSDEEIVVVADDERASAPAAELGYRFHRDVTADAAWRRGRQANPLAALADHLRAFGGTLRVAPVMTVDEGALQAGAEQLAEQVSIDPVEGDLIFQGATVERVEPADGQVVEAEDIAAAVRPVVAGEVDGPVEVAREPASPETSSEDVDAVAAQAEQALSAPVTLTRDGVTWRVQPAELAATLDVERDGSDLSLVIDADAVEEIAGDVPDQVASEPVDAEVRIVDGSPQITPSEDGFAFDLEAATDQLLDVATGPGERTAELDGEMLEPDRTTADAEALNITEVVSSFTTEFTPGQSRVQNIQRIAEIVDGVLIEPDETFSVNGYVGERTREKGFVEGGAILEGEFIEDVGGGVSQFATTMYNAAYFGGYAIPDFKPHSYYISRYPAGREATLDFPHVDLKVRNNSPHGLLVTTSSTDSSVTVTMWGTEWVEVESEAGERRNVTQPETRRRETDDLPVGQERVVQSGREGFTITVTRVLRFPDGEVARQEVTTRYDPEPRIIEVGTG